MIQTDVGNLISGSSAFSKSSLNIWNFSVHLLLMASMWNAKLDEAQAGIKIARRNVNKLRHADDTTLKAESEEELKTSWWNWKKRVKKLA